MQFRRAARTCRFVLSVLGTVLAVLAVLLHVTFRVLYSTPARQIKAARMVEDGWHPLAAAVVGSTALPTDPDVRDYKGCTMQESPADDSPAACEADWPCMAHFAGLQERHLFTADSWVVPPRRWLPRIAGSPTIVAAAAGGEQRTTASGDNRPRVIIAGIARDIPAGHLNATIPELVRLGQSAVFADYHLLIYENNSPPDSRRAICEAMAAVAPKSSFLFEDLLPAADRGRTHNIARARNVIVDWVQAHTVGFDYMIVTDLDSYSGARNDCSFDHDVLAHAFARQSEWDALSFLSDPYWDLWAFRHPTIHPRDHFGPNGPDQQTNPLKTVQEITAWLKAHGQEHPGELISVDSAFMMSSIYRLAAIGDCRYSPLEPRTRTGTHNNAVKSALAAVGWKGGGHPPVCEHVPFHHCIRGAGDGDGQLGRVRILPKVLCTGATGWENLSSSHRKMVAES